MKKLYTILGVILCIGFAACTNEDEETVGLAIENIPNPIFFSAPNFPSDDGSISFENSESRSDRFAKLLEATTPDRALDATPLDITEEQMAKIKAFADDLCTTATSETQKIKLLTKWCKENITYDYTNNNAWSVFEKRTGVCQGYANLLKAMLLSQGIPCVVVNGYYDYYGHAWNYAYSAKDKQWFICDPTNSTSTYYLGSSSASHLQPEMADIILFEDDGFCYNYYENNLNVCTVKSESTDLVVPFSAGGYRVTMFNPSTAIPASVKNIYIGKNITSLGQNIKGLVAYRSSDEMCYVDPDNEWYGSANGVIYNKDWQGNLTSIVYIPSMMKTVTLLPMEKVEKNTIIDQEGVEVIIFSEGTKYIEAYAIESCPNLRTVYVPEGCKMDKDAIYRCPKNVNVIIGNPTGIKQVKV